MTQSRLDASPSPDGLAQYGGQYKSPSVEPITGNPDRTLYVANSNSVVLWKAAYRLMFGLPGAFIMPFDRDLKYESYEPEWSFLVRHNLLLPEDSPEFITPTKDAIDAKN